MGWGSWGGWFSDSGESSNEKVTVNDDGSTKYEKMRTIDNDKDNHQHSWVNRDSDGKVTSGGSTPNRQKK